MKKTLLLVVALMAAIAVKAQLPELDNGSKYRVTEEKGKATLVGTPRMNMPPIGPYYDEEEDSVTTPEKVSIYMTRPTNLLWFYRTQSNIGYGIGMLMAPPFATTTFNAVAGDSITSTFYYQRSSTLPGNNRVYIASGTSFSIAYPNPYADYCRAPYVRGTNANMTDSTYIPATYIWTGQQNLYLAGSLSAFEYGGTTSYGRVPMANHWVGQGGMSINQYYLANTQLCKTSLSSVYSGSGITVDSVKGFGEYFYAPASPLAIQGVMIRVYSTDQKLTGNHRIAIRDAGLNLVAYAEGDSAAIATKLNDYEWNLVFNNLKDASGNAIDEVVMNGAFTVYLEFQPENSNLMPVWHANIPEKSMRTIRVWGDFTQNGTAYTNANIGLSLNFSSGVQTSGLALSLFADYQWLEVPTTTFAAAGNGETLPVTVYSSRAASNWTITQSDDTPLPDWLTYTAVDSIRANGSYGQETTLNFKAAAMPTDLSERSCEVKITYAGITKTITITQDQTVAQPVGELTYATMYYGNVDLVVPTGMEASTYYVSQGQLIESKTYAAGDVIPRGTAVVLHSTTPGTYRFAGATTSGTGDDKSMLYGGDDEVNDAQAGYLYYILTTPKDDPNGKVGFYWQVENGDEVESAPHKAYLKVPESEAAGAKFLPFDGNATGIKTIDELTSKQVNEWYTVDGQKLNAQPTQKGVYIQNGKKVTIK